MFWSIIQIILNLYFLIVIIILFLIYQILLLKLIIGGKDSPQEKYIKVLLKVLVI